MVIVDGGLGVLVPISAVRVTVPASASVAVAAVVVKEEQADNVRDEASRPDGDDQFRLRDLCESAHAGVRHCVYDMGLDESETNRCS